MLRDNNWGLVDKQCVLLNKVSPKDEIDSAVEFVLMTII